MKISQIRDIIQASSYWRRDLSGHTQDEYMRRNVPEVFGKYIAEMQALDIAPRFVQDRIRRDEEVTYCKAVIKRWRAMQLLQTVPCSVIQ